MGGEANYADLRRRVVAHLLAPFKIRNILSKAGAIHGLALVCILEAVDSASFEIASGHIRVGRLVNRRDMQIVSRGAAIGQA